MKNYVDLFNDDIPVKDEEIDNLFADDIPVEDEEIDDLFVDNIASLKKNIKKHKLDINKVIRPIGSTLFQLTCFNSKSFDPVEYLIEKHHADLFKKDPQGRDSLFYAAMNKNPLGFLVYRQLKQTYQNQLKMKMNKEFNIKDDDKSK